MTVKKSLFTTLFLLSGILTFAQSTSTFRGQESISLSPDNITTSRDFPIANDGPFLSYCVKSATEVNGLLIRFSIDGTTWTDWQAIENDTHAQANEPQWISALGFIDAPYRFYQIKSTTEEAAITISFFNPQFTERVANTQGNESTIANRSCNCPIPSFQNRSQWCPGGNCPEHSNPTYTQVTHLIVHHSAGSNSSNDWAAVVRAIWTFHVVDRGWSDIGYNWLIAPSGEIFQGRGDNIMGAHFCSTNSRTMGVCMMGNYMTVAPTDTAVTRLQELLAWKACREDIDPLHTKYHPSSGLYLKQISGHRDGCATACPGDVFYPMLSDVRQQVSLKVINNCANIFMPAPLSGSILDNHVQLVWADNSDNETGFLLERNNGGETDFELLAALPENTTEYLDETIDEDVYYGYRLRSYNNQDTSTYTNELWVSTTFGVATNDFINHETVKLFPNPTKGQVTLRIDNEITGNIYLEILTPEMKQVKKMLIQKDASVLTYSIDTDELPTGIYFVKIRQGANQGVFKLLKIHDGQ